MFRKIVKLTPLLLATVALALVVGLWPSGQADATGHSATRTFSADSVGPWGRDNSDDCRLPAYGGPSARW